MGVGSHILEGKRDLGAREPTSREKGYRLPLVLQVERRWALEGTIRRKRICTTTRNLLRATGPVHLACTLYIPYKHLSHAAKPVTLRSRLVHILLFTSLNLDYLTFPLFSYIFLFFSCTQHEPLTKLLCQDVEQHNTVYCSFSRSFLSFLSKF